MLRCWSSSLKPPGQLQKRLGPKKRGARPQWRNNVILPNNKCRRWKLMWLLLPILLAGCAPSSTRYVAVEGPAVPPLPSEARVSRVPTPSVCSSTCSKGWNQLVEKSLSTLTD